MASLLEKIQVLVSADLNRVVDRALKSNDPAVFRQHLRELQSTQEQLFSQMAALEALVMRTRQRNEEQQALVAKQDSEVDQLVQGGFHEEALAAQDRLNQARVESALLADQLASLEAQSAQLLAAKTELDARFTALRRREPEVESLSGVARAKELTAAAMASLNDLTGSGDPDTARVVDAIRTRLAEAEAQLHMLEQKGLAHGETPEVLKRKELESQLEARKARLGGQ